MLFENKNVFVTGSTSGIGRATAIAFAKEGATVLVHGRKESSRMNETLELLEKIGATAKPIYGDFSEPGCIDSFIEQAWTALNGIDVLVNNAGGDVLTKSLANETLEAKFDYLQNVDVKSTLLFSRRAGELMVKNRIENQSNPPSSTGAIINIGWDQAWQGMEGESGELFATTKGAIMAMSKSLSQSLAPHVRVNCVAPGWIKTDWGETASDYWSQRARAESLMNRWGTPEDVASAVVFLASDQASFISGQILAVNGGFRSSNFSLK